MVANRREPYWSDGFGPAHGLRSAQLRVELEWLAGLAATACDVPIVLVSLRHVADGPYAVVVGPEVPGLAGQIAAAARSLQDAVPHNGELVFDLLTQPSHLADEVGLHLCAVASISIDSHPIGALCALDLIARPWSHTQMEMLEHMARQISIGMELRTARQTIAIGTAQLSALRADKNSMTKQPRASAELFRTFMNNSPVASFIKDPQGRYVFCNKKYAEAFGLEAGANPAQPGAQDDDFMGRLEFEDNENATEILERIEEVPREDGHIRHWKSFQFPCRDEMGQALLGCIAIDVSEEIRRAAELARYQAELESANELLRNLSVTDDLTGLRNRRAFEERLDFEFSMARRKKRDLAVVLIDADDFKKVNDRFGHAAGDTVLQQLGKVLQDCVRVTDLPVRFGGEEFAVILPESDEQSAMLWCGRLQRRLAAVRWDHHPVTVSMGVADLSPDCIDRDHLVALADQALYRAKRLGKNRTIGSSELDIGKAG